MTRFFDPANRQPKAATGKGADDCKKWLWWGYLVLGGLLLFRLGYIVSGLVELSPDEPLFWIQSKHLALSYYSKPPMLAYTQFLGTAIWGDNDLGVRFFSPVISAIIGIVLPPVLRPGNQRTPRFCAGAHHERHTAFDGRALP